MLFRLSVVFALLGVIAVLIAGTHGGRVAVKTLLLIPQVVPSLKFHPQEWFTQEPVVEQVALSMGSRQGDADLYRPGGSGKHGGVVLFLGHVAPAAHDDPRVVGLGKALARAGTVVLVPWPRQEKRVDVGEIEQLVFAFQYLADQGFVDRTRLGLAGFCVGASIALVAAADPRIRSEVAFVNAFGAYFDARDFMKQISSGHSFYNGVVELWEPDRLTREVFNTQLMESVADREERQALERALAHPGGSLEGVAELTPQARAVFRLLAGGTLQEADRALAQLAPEAQEQLRAISPSVVIDRVDARVLIMHDREDNLVPSEESRRLADALAPRGNVYYTEFSFFQHLDPTRRVKPWAYVKEVVKLYLHMFQVLRLVA
ncbi:MAG: hypothetical protein HYY31_05155 [Chloroflexi bacterium]|nr:hypothetical protein [Chloroflexota bacterium]